MTLQEQIATLPDPEFHQLRAWMQEQARQRAARPLVDAGQAAVMRDLRESGQIPAPDVGSSPDDECPQWVDPGQDPARMYLKGDHVAHEQCTWRSEHEGMNRVEPGVDDAWSDATPEVEVEP